MKKTLFLSAILATALCSSAFADSATTAYTVKDGVTYNGGIYTLSGTGNFSVRKFTADMDSTDGSIKATSTTGWTSFASGASRVYGHTLHLTAANSDTSITTDFDPFTVGGLIVDEGTGTWTVGRASGTNLTLTQIWGNGDAHMSINGSVTLLGGKGVEVKSGGTWAIAEGKTLTLSTGGQAQAVSFADDTAVILSGQGTLALNGASLTFGTGASITVGANNTLALTTGTDWTMVGEETPRTSGNGFGTATYTRNFGTSIVNNGTITVNGSVATMTDGVVTGTGNSTTYYVNEGANVSSLTGATALVVNSTSGGVNQLGLSHTTYGNLDITINGGRVITARDDGTAFTTGDVVVKGGGTLAVVESGHDALGWGTGKTKSITLCGTDEDSLATFEMSYAADKTLTMETALNLNGHSRVSGTRKFNTYGGVITATGTDNIISSGVELRKAASFVVNENSTLEISGNVVYGQDNDRSMTKTGAGVLTISGNISGTDASKMVSITGDGANTIISSGTISNATLTNVTLAKGSTQTINGTVTMDAATVANRLNIMSGSSLTLQNGMTDTSTNSDEFAIVMGNTGDTGNTLTFGSGTYDLSKHNIGVAVFANNTMTVQSGAAVTLKAVYYGSSLDNNGTVTVDDGGVLNIIAGSTSATHLKDMNANGTVTVANNFKTKTDLIIGGSFTQTAGTATIGDHVNLTDGGSLTLSGSAAMIATVYLNMSGNTSVELTDTATLTVKGPGDNRAIWMQAGDSISLAAGATVSLTGTNFDMQLKGGTITADGGVQIGGAKDDDVSQGSISDSAITVSKGALREYNISGGSVTVNSGTETTIKSALSDTTALTVNGGSTATFSGNATVASVAGAGSLNLSHKLTVAGNATIGSLTLSNGANLTAETISGEHNGTVNITDLTVNGTSEVNANLVVNGGTITFADNATLTMGCSVTIGSTNTVTVELTEEMVSTIAGGGRVDLFTDVEGAQLVNGNIVFTGVDGATLDKANVYSLQYDETTKTIYAAPEPATATLSLLALAALCARRKRH